MSRYMMGFMFFGICFLYLATSFVVMPKLYKIDAKLDRLLESVELEEESPEAKK